MMVIPEVISLDSLSVDVRYGREIRKAHVRKIVRDWSDLLCLPIVVSERRDGTRWVIDGFHRVTARRKLGLKDIVATVHHGLSYEEEAMMFVELNRNRIGHRPLDQFRAMLEGGHPDCVEISATIEGLGGYIGHGGGIECVGTLRELYSDAGHRGLRWILLIVRDAWGVEGLSPPGADQYTLRAITHLWFSQFDVIQRKRLVDVLSAATAETISSEGHRVTTTRHGMGRATGTIIAIADRYNHGLPRASRIEAAPIDRRLLRLQAESVTAKIKRLEREEVAA